MVKLLFSVMLEAAAGISLAGFALALIVPALNYLRPAPRGSAAAQAVIGAVIVLVTTAVLFRPGSAINRWRRR